MAAIDQAIKKLDALITALGGAAKLEAAKASAAALAAAAAPAPAPATPAPASPAPAAQPKAASGKPEPKAAAADGAAAPKPKKEKKAAAPKAAPAPAEPVDLFSKAKLVVGHMLEAEPVENSEKLLKCRIGVGGDEVRQVVAGLQQFIAADQLAGSHVVVITNLKPAKLAGQASEAMILAADATVGDTLLVKTLVPPAGSAAGDAVYLEGGAAADAHPKVLKSDDWKKIVAGLSVASSRPTFEGKAFCTAKGAVTLPAEIPNGSGIH